MKYRNTGWIVIGVLVLIPVVRWFQINSFELYTSDSTLVASMVGRLAALVGIVLYAINFVLSTRHKLLDSLFGGLNRAYVAHHFVGGLALIALLIHPLALSFQFIPDQMRLAAEFLVPVLAPPVEVAIVFGNLAFFGLVLLMILTFVVKLPYQVWLLTHKFLGLAFLFGGLHAMLIPSDVANDLFTRVYILGFTVIGLLAFVYRTLLPKIFIRKEKYEVVSLDNVAKDITRIEMKPTNGFINYLPGQFIFISFDQKGFPKETHPFSVTSSAKDELSVTVKSVGDFTSKIKALKPGATAFVEGAFGKFTYSNYRKPKQIWVAGGIGITPFISMAKSIKKSHKTPEISLFYSVKERSELVDDKLFADLQKITNFTYESYVGGENKDYLTAAYIKEKAGDLSDCGVFICGPPAMMTGLKQQFIDLGVAKSNIHTEEFKIS